MYFALFCRDLETVSVRRAMGDPPVRSVPLVTMDTRTVNLVPVTVQAH